MWGSTAALLLLLLLSRPHRRGGLVILLPTAIITTILVITTTGAMVDDVNVVAAMGMAMVVLVIVEVVDLIEDDRGPTLLATTRIGIDVAAVVVAVGEEGDTAVVALERVIGTSIIVMPILVLLVVVVVAAGDIMEDHRIEDHRHHRTMTESRHMHPNGMQNSQCCVDFFGRRSWRKNRLSLIPR